MKSIQYLLAIFLILSLVSCSKMAKFFPERPDDNVTFPPGTPEDFKLGYRDGCTSGMAGGSNTFYKFFYDMQTADGFKMASSSEYRAGYNNGLWFCYRYDYVKHKRPVWGSIFNGYI